MLYSTWISFVLIFGLFHSSYQFNRTNKDRRLRKRESPLLQRTMEKTFSKVVNDQDTLEDLVRSKSRDEQDQVRAISKKIFEVVDKILKTGVKDFSSIDQWKLIRDEIRRGIITITGVYRDFIKYHRETCESLETVAEDMVLKYSKEMDLINELDPPLTDDLTDRSSEKYIRAMKRFIGMLNYAQLHATTMSLALTVPQSLYDLSMSHRTVVMAPQPRTTTYQVVHIVDPATTPNLVSTTRSLEMRCNQFNIGNGMSQCSNDISAQTSGCACQLVPTCPLQQQVYA